MQAYQTPQIDITNQNLTTQSSLYRLDLANYPVEQIPQVFGEGFQTVSDPDVPFMDTTFNTHSELNPLCFGRDQILGAGFEAPGYNTLFLESDFSTGGFTAHDAQLLAPQATFAPNAPSKSNISRTRDIFHATGTPGMRRSRHACSFTGCKKTFGRPAEFRRHMKTIHKRDETPGIQCMMCNYTYPRIDKVVDSSMLIGFLLAGFFAAHLSPLFFQIDSHQQESVITLP
ncbi:hypothetical protein BU23DRAFT_656829 [Bimuria novae-zelandiae CBS 107.79]|uniref:C2H2-type domain-containing protein n=1 Tax=Bimuria novae-zelandiae CBS 107.79 TaxID=1447943 RepID=A0A6A5V461_9PLEO|nr:hypothetical protein BU23DRAFT_656829 [Bimuria novae-zelandiae CBS 107.79]